MMRRRPSLADRPRWLKPAAALLLLALSAGAATAQAPLHQRIDAAIAAGTPNYEKQAAPLASDAEFLRRIYLDLTGTIPSADEARAFLKDGTPDRRAKLIDRLLASPAFARHMATVFDVLLMDRRPAKFVPAPQWHEFLRASFAAGKPLDQLVQEILAADGADPKTRPAARFYLDRNGEPHQLTRDVSRLFLGMNLQCAQCHDHPLVAGYLQAHYYGLYAFLSRSFVFNDKATKLSVFAEKAEGEVTYQSVFDPTKLTKTTGPRLPSGPGLKEPALEKGKEYVVAPVKGQRPVPRFSRRALLPGLIAGADNMQFRRTVANRLWAMMLGRGLVDPVDFDHPANPASHPELLKTLTDEVAALKFDVKAFLREAALSKTYQRSSELPKGVEEASPRTFAVAAVRPLSPEQFAWAAMQATGLVDADRKALGTRATEAALYARLSGNVIPFVQVFGGPAGQPDDGFQATLDQTLFLKNGTLLRSWLAPRPGNLTERLGRLMDAGAVAEELYLSALTRPPSDEEKREVADYLAGRASDRAAALQELAWALITSAEFRFNY